MGQWCSEPLKMANVLVDFYSGLFSFTNTFQPDVTLESIHSLVTDDMNLQLSSEFL